MLLVNGPTLNPVKKNKTPPSRKKRYTQMMDVYFNYLIDYFIHNTNDSIKAYETSTHQNVALDRNGIAKILQKSEISFLNFLHIKNLL